jgi:hypothetical protein
LIGRTRALEDKVALGLRVLKADTGEGIRLLVHSNDQAEA